MITTRHRERTHPVLQLSPRAELWRWVVANDSPTPKVGRFRLTLTLAFVAAVLTATAMRHTTKQHFATAWGEGVTNHNSALAPRMARMSWTRERTSSLR